MDIAIAIGCLVGWGVWLTLIGFTDLNGLLIAGIGGSSAFLISTFIGNFTR